MQDAVVDVGVGVNLRPQRHIALAAVHTFAAGRHEVIMVDTLDEGGLLGDPCSKSRLGDRVGGKGAGLVGYLPRHQRGRLGIGAPGIAVGAAHHVAHMPRGQGLGRVTADKAGHVGHIAVVAIDGRIWCGTLAGPLEISAVTAAPLPGVVEIDHGLHAAALELSHQIVQAVEDGVVVHARRSLEHGHDMRWYVLVAVAAREHTQIGHTE